MSDSMTITDVAELIKAGDLAEAKRRARGLLADADPHDLDVIARCAYTLETWPKIGVVKLRAYWQNANQHDRAIIEACAPEDGQQRERAESSRDRSPHWTATNTYQAPRDIRREVRPELRRPARQRPTDDGSAVLAVYLRERAGVDDDPQRDDPLTGYPLDYDRAALPPLHGTPCVSCWLERASCDRTGGHDNGLCSDCRDRGRPGIPSLPAGHTRADAIAARCAHIAARYPTAAVRLLRRYWQQSSNPQDRDVVAAWVRDHGLTPAQTAPAPVSDRPESAELTACTSCTEPRGPRDVRHVSSDDGLCTQCRAAGSDATPHHPVADDGRVNLTYMALPTLAAV